MQNGPFQRTRAYDTPARAVPQVVRSVGGDAATAFGGGMQACTPHFGHWIDTLVQVVRNAAVPSAQGAISPARGLRLQHTSVTGQGNADGAAWSDDGTTLYLANGESDLLRGRWHWEVAIK
jgi:hypothetical protein